MNKTLGLALLAGLAVLAWFVFKSQSSYEPQTNSAETSNSWTQYARGFNVDSVGIFKILSIYHPQKSDRPIWRYLLIPNNMDPATEIPDSLIPLKKIFIPVSKVVPLSSIYIPYLKELKAFDKVIGVSLHNRISNPEFRQLMTQKNIPQLGEESLIDFEALFTLTPDLILTYGGTSAAELHPQLRNPLLSVVVTTDYLETHPLGRAEWIRCFGLLFNQSQLADSVFNEIETNYQNYKQLVRPDLKKPTVFGGILYGDAWHQSGGQSYMAGLLSDAGANYLWSDNPETGSLVFSLEEIMTRAGEADYWINPGMFTSLIELKNSDPRYTFFKAYQNHQVFGFASVHNGEGSYDFFETGNLRVDLMLADLIKVFHPNLIPDHQSVWIKKLENDLPL
jgi:iron complex transport system substrate-binding protein